MFDERSLITGDHLASDPCPDGHEGTESAAALNHDLPNILDQLASSHTHPQGPHAAKYGTCSQVLM